MTRLMIAIIAVAMCAGSAQGMQNPLRDRMLRNERTQESVGWFQRVDTGEFFLFDRSGGTALLRERDDPYAEVLVLTGNRAAGGGTSYVTDTGREVVRVTGLGGTTYFPDDAPDGVIAEYASPARGIAPTPRSSREVHNLAGELVDDLLRSLDHTVSVEYTPAPRSGLGVQYDALNMISLAFQSLRSSDRRRARVIEQVALVTGTSANAYVEDNTLTVEIDTSQGYAGRPSSAAIARAITGR